MKQLTSYNRVAGYLNKIFDLLNAEYFENELSRPTITIQSTPKAYGHFSLKDDTWVSSIGNSHEINIGAGTLARPIEEVIATLLHEMVHYCNYQNGIQDCSRGNTYHNKRFKATAEACDLRIEYDPRIGWSITFPTEALIDFIVTQGWEDIRMGRMDGYISGRPGRGTSSGTGEPPKPKKPSSTRKYICPNCKMSVRATREVNILCGDCLLKMELSE